MGRREVWRAGHLLPLAAMDGMLIELLLIGRGFSVENREERERWLVRHTGRVTEHRWPIVTCRGVCVCAWLGPRQ